ncbi:MAG: NUDIX hydrolase [Bacteroidota bacterium]
MNKVKIHHRKWLLEDFLKVEEVQLQYEKFDGNMSDKVRLLSLERGDAVAALIWDISSQKLLLAKQFRLPAYNKGEGWVIEAIAGGLKADEDPEEAIKREISEEIGFLPKKVTHIHTFFVSPGGTSERILLYFGKVSEQEKIDSGGGLADENEDIEMVSFTPEIFFNAIENGEIIDAKTIIAGLWLKNNIQLLKP